MENMMESTKEDLEERTGTIICPNRKCRNSQGIKTLPLLEFLHPVYGGEVFKCDEYYCPRCLSKCYVAVREKG